MKNKKTRGQATGTQPKGKVKLKNLELHKETIQNLSTQDAEAVRGGVKAAHVAGTGVTDCYNCPSNVQTC